ncbi:MAG TPA: hypothetical protein VG099_06550 [Gemmataceae bacterium]|jgi:hypothetical protein|nr:hypothetical protein [Gemmataceae bacterium]
MRALRLPNGNLLIPVEPDESDANDCMAEITADDLEYGGWLALAEEGEDPRRKPEE